MRKSPTTADTTEARLEALIAECHQIIRDVVLPSATAVDSDMERRRYLDSAVELVRSATTVGDTVARLRGGAAAGEHRQRITVERVQALPALPGCPTPRGEGG